MKEYSRPAAELLKLDSDLLTASNEDPLNPPPINPPIEVCIECVARPSQTDPYAEACPNTRTASMVNRSGF